MTIYRIELKNNKKMRWYFSFWNKENRRIFIAVRKEDSYISDEKGNRYEILNTSSNFLNSYVEPGIKTKEWLEFPFPIDNAKDFRLYLNSGNAGIDIQFDPIDIILP
jgi:hypothetical protein